MKKLALKLTLWIALSTAYMLLLFFVLLPAGEPEVCVADRYWEIILQGQGRELKREDGRVYFVWQTDRGWWYFRTSEDEIQNTMELAVRDYVDYRLDLRTSNTTGEMRLDVWDERQFEALTGYEFCGQQEQPNEWWQENREQFAPTSYQVRRFLREREEQVLLLEQLWMTVDHPRGPQYTALQNNRHMGHMRKLYWPSAEDRIQRWRRSKSVTVAFECVYGPFLALCFVFPLPWVYRTLRASGWSGPSSRLAVGYLGFALLLAPCVVGYSPYWFGPGYWSARMLFVIGSCAAAIMGGLLGLAPERWKAPWRKRSEGSRPR